MRAGQLRGPARPRPAAPGVALVMAVGSCWVIARTTGAGWVVVLGCTLVATLVVGTVRPWWSLRRLHVEVAGPVDGLAGAPLHLTLTASQGSGPVVVTPTDPPGSPVVVDPPAAGSVSVVPARRGLLGTVTVRVASAGPFGLVTWVSHRDLPLPAPVAVAPRSYAGPVPVPAAAGDATAVRPRAGDGDLTRGAREYRDGEPIRLVHWPATARAGTVMIRETEAGRRTRCSAVVDLRGDPDLAETVASWAAAALTALLAAGAEVELHSCEPHGPVGAPVRNTVEVGRRLARAVAGPPSPPPGDAPGTVRFDVEALRAAGLTPGAPARRTAALRPAPTGRRGRAAGRYRWPTGR